MAKTIDQTVEFGWVSAERLFDLYMDPEQHKAGLDTNYSSVLFIT